MPRTNTDYTFISTTSQILWRIVESYGVDPAPIFGQAGLDIRAWEDPESRFENAKLDAAWMLAIEQTGDPCLGLRAARFANPASLHALGFAWLASDTLYDALSRAVRYFRLVTDGADLELAVSGAECRLAIGESRLERRSGDEVADAFWSTVIAMCRMSASDDFAPLALALYRPEPPCVADFYALFRAPITFNAGRDEIVFRRTEVERPLPTANRLLARTNDQVIDDYLARHDAQNLADQVRAYVVEALPGGRIESEDIAAKLHMSRRSLQRHLADEGTSYSALLDESRRELALRYIGEERMPVKEVTYVLGFSEPANFTRAFRRWTGQSPTEYRASSVG